MIAHPHRSFCFLAGWDKNSFASENNSESSIRTVFSSTLTAMESFKLCRGVGAENMNGVVLGVQKFIVGVENFQ